MSEKDDQISYIVRSEPSSEYASVRDEMVRLSGAFSSAEQLTPEEVRRFSSKGIDATSRLVILSQMLLPELCSIVERGLTLEELGLLIGTDPVEMKRILKKPVVKKAAIIIPGAVEKSSFVKVLVPLKKITRSADGIGSEMVVQESMLAPKRLVEKIRRSGYTTEDGRVLRYDYLSKVSGPLPAIYLFQNSREMAEEIVGDGWNETVAEMMVDDPGLVKASLEIAIALLEQMKPILMSEYASLLIEQVADFFLDAYEHAVHYAWRYRALNDRDVFEKIVALAKPFLYAADGLRNCDWTKDPDSRQKVVDAIDQVLADFQAVIEGRASLSPEVTSERSSD